MNIEKIAVVPDSDPRADIRDDTEQEQVTRVTVASSLPKGTVASPVNRCSDLATMAFAALRNISAHCHKPECYASEACKAVYNSLPKARDILNRHGKLFRQSVSLLVFTRWTAWRHLPPCFECKAIP